MKTFNVKFILSFVRYMNGLKRAQKDDYFLFLHPNIQDRWLTESELLDDYVNVQKPIKFAEEMAVLIYQIRVEGEWIYEYESYSREFGESIVDNPFHSQVMINKIKLNLLDGIDSGEFLPNEDGEFEYNPDMMDCADFMESYIEDIYNKNQEI